MLLDCINTAVKARAEGMPVNEVIRKLNLHEQELHASKDGSNAVDGTVMFLLTPEKQQ